MSPSLYDLLDVDETASEDEIREAWKAAIADLGPTDRRFRAYNQAAEVLLDPEKRAEYDAERASEAEGTEPEDAAVPEEPGTEEPKAEEPKEPGAEGPEPEVEESEEPRESRQPAAWMVGVVALVALAVLGVTAWQWISYADSDGEGEWVDGAIDAAVETAPKALAYDYRSIDEDISAAQDLMTSDQRARHNELMSDLRGDVVSQKAVVESVVVGSGLVRGNDERAEILVLVNQHTTKAGGGQGQKQETLIPLWVTFEMVNVDGEWLLDRMVNEGEVASSGESQEDEPGEGGTASPTAPETSPSPTDAPGTSSPDDTNGAGE